MLGEEPDSRCGDPHSARALRLTVVLRWFAAHLHRMAHGRQSLEKNFLLRTHFPGQ